MKEEQKKSILERYKIALNKGERFWPDSIYKDLIVSFAIFIALIMLATFIGVPGEPKADPSDSAYIPKPEWYFLFLFKFLALYGQIPVVGKIEWLATAVIPALAIGVLVILPLIDRNPSRHYSRRVTALTVMGVFLVSTITLTMISDIPTTTLGLLQSLAGLIVPGAAFVALFVLSLFAKKAMQAIGHIQIWIAAVAALAMLALGGAVLIFAPKPAAAAEVTVANTVAEKINLGRDLYAINCTECHGEDGKVETITGVAALEGKIITPINSTDVMYTLTDESLTNIIAYGQQALGMQPFAKAFGGELSPSEIDYIVTFMRYTWDDRSVLPAGAALSSVPELNPGEVPSYDVHIKALTKSYCLSCHRAGKENNNYLMSSYDDLLNGGDNAPVMTAGDPYSLVLQLVNGHEGLDPKTNKAIRQMPPSKLMNQKYIDMLTLWVLSGMPQTAEEAAALQPVPTTGDAIYLEGDKVAGAAVFTAQCEKCHGAQGAVGVENPGSADGSVPSLNPIDPEIKNADPLIFAANLDQYIQSGSVPEAVEGQTPKLTMPAFGKDKTIPQLDIANVIAYLLSLNP